MGLLGLLVLLFGGKKIPEVAKGPTEGIKNFGQAIKTEKDTLMAGSFGIFALVFVIWLAQEDRSRIAVYPAS